MNALPSKPFWMVYGIGQGAPTVMHETSLAAQNEAKRLARRNEGVTFVVLEAVGAVVKDDLKTVSFPRDAARIHASHDSDDDIPF